MNKNLYHTENECNELGFHLKNMTKIMNDGDEWKNNDLSYIIKNEKFQIKTGKELFNMIQLTTLMWVMKNTDFTPVSNHERIHIFLHFQKERGF
jgi:hypothetical protein